MDLRSLRLQIAAGHPGHQLVPSGEDTLLHLASGLRAKDDHLLALEGHNEGSRRGHALGPPVEWEDPSIEDDSRLVLAAAGEKG